MPKKYPTGDAYDAPETDETTETAATETAAAESPPPPTIKPQLGGVATVRPAPGTQVMNLETRQVFAEAGESVLVTARILRLLADGDLIQV